MIEKPIQDTAINILEANNVQYIHIPNSTFQGGKKRSSKLKNHPDLTFTYGKKFYMREFGIHGRHEARKHEQWLRMQEWEKQAPSITDISMIWSNAELMDDFKRIGLIK